MNKAQLREIIEEELQSVLKEFKSIDEAGPLSDQERHYQRANAHAANEIEDFISNRLIKLAGPVEEWTPEHLETFEQINNLLNVLFPSGK